MRTLEQREVIQQADAIKRAERKASKAARPKRERPAPGPNPKDPRERDVAYLRWLHEGLSCIACLIEHPGFVWSPSALYPVEAAHQKLAIASRGWREGGLGPRVHDRRCVPLCSWHHTQAPNACDKGQRHFWDRLGLFDKVADLCRDLYAAFLAGGDGEPVIHRYAEEARGFERRRTASEA